jgi:hypothetical protein
MRALAWAATLAVTGKHFRSRLLGAVCQQRIACDLGYTWVRDEVWAKAANVLEHEPVIHIAKDARDRLVSRLPSWWQVWHGQTRLGAFAACIGGLKVIQASVEQNSETMDSV